MNKSNSLCINIDSFYDYPLSEKLNIIKGSGFDAVFYDKERYESTGKSALLSISPFVKH